MMLIGTTYIDSDSKEKGEVKEREGIVMQQRIPSQDATGLRYYTYIMSLTLSERH